MIALIRIFNNLKNSSFFIAVFKVSTGQMIGQVLSLIALPILSRIYAGITFGEQALVISTASIVINFTTLGLNSAIMKPADDNESKRVLSVAFTLNVLITTFLVILCLMFSSKFTVFNVSGSYNFAILLAWMYTVLTNTSGLLNTYINRKGEYGRLFFNPIIGGLGNFLIAIPLGLFGMGYVGLLVAGIVSSFFTCIYMAWKDVPIYRDFQPKDIIDVIKEYREYILFQYPANCIDNTTYEYPTQFLGRTFSSADLGGYAMCLRVLKYPIRLIAAPISTVYFKTATKYYQDGKNLSFFTYKIISRILLISLVPVIILCVYSESLFVFVLGDNWHEAGTIAAILSVQFVFMFCSQCTSYCRVAIEKQKANLSFAIFRLILTVASASIGYLVCGNIIGTILILSVTQSICWMTDLGLNFWLMDKRMLGKYVPISIIYAVIVYAVVIIKLL